jgi:hypothetical protein
MKLAIALILSVLLAFSPVFAEGDNNRGTTGQGSTSTGSDAQGSASQPRSGR